MSILGNVAGLGAIQPDWAQTDEKRADFIRNKPDFNAFSGALEQLRELAQNALPKAGGTMAGDIRMGGNRLTDLPEPQEGTDAATKAYVDAAGSGVQYLQLTLTAEGWSGVDGGPYIQQIYRSGITAEDRPHFGLVFTGDREARLAQKEDWAKVDDLDTEGNYLTFTCLQEKPSVDLTVQLELQRGGASSETAALLTLEEGADSAVQAEVEGVSYGAANASLNGEPAGQEYDFTVL